jgi:hypothetical protein
MLFTAEGLGKVLTAFRKHEPEYYPLTATLALTGIRYGERLACGGAISPGPLDRST